MQLSFKYIYQLVLLGLALSPNQADALVLLQQATVATDVEYDSNTGLTSSNEQSVWRYTVSPKYAVSAVDDRTKWFATAGLNLQQSSNNAVSGSRQDPAVSAGWEYQFEKSTLNITADYTKSSSRLNEFITSGIVDKDGSLTSKSISASWGTQRSDRLGLSVASQYLKTDYNSSVFTNSTTKSISTSLTYELNDKVKPFIQVGVAQLNSARATARSTISKTYLLGSTFDIKPQLKMSVSLGLNQQQIAGNGWVANTTLNYIEEKYLVRAILSRNVAPSGLGDFQKTNNLTLNYSYELSDKARVGTDFIWNMNGATNGSETRQLTGWYSKELSDFWQFKLSLNLKDLKNNSQSANASIFGVSFIYNTQEF
jgi:hypothetical protein